MMDKSACSARMRTQALTHSTHKKAGNLNIAGGEGRFQLSVLNEARPRAIKEGSRDLALAFLCMYHIETGKAGEMAHHRELALQYPTLRTCV